MDAAVSNAITYLVEAVDVQFHGECSQDAVLDRVIQAVGPARSIDDITFVTEDGLKIGGWEFDHTSVALAMIGDTPTNIGCYINAVEAEFREWQSLRIVKEYIHMMSAETVIAMGEAARLNPVYQGARVLLDLVGRDGHPSEVEALVTEWFMMTTGCLTVYPDGDFRVVGFSNITMDQFRVMSELLIEAGQTDVTISEVGGDWASKDFSSPPTVDDLVEMVREAIHAGL